MLCKLEMIGKVSWASPNKLVIQLIRGCRCHHKVVLPHLSLPKFQETHISWYRIDYVNMFLAHLGLCQMVPGGGGTVPTIQRIPLPGAEMLEEEPLYVNAKQYHRILKRRQARAKLEAEGKIPKERRVSDRCQAMTWHNMANWCSI